MMPLGDDASMTTAATPERIPAFRDSWARQFLPLAEKPL